MKMMNTMDEEREVELLGYLNCRLNCTFGPRILTSSRKWSRLFQIEQNRP